MAKKRVEVEVGFSVDESGPKKIKNSFEQIQDSLKQIKGIDINTLIKGNPKLDTKQATQELTRLQELATKVEAALNKSYNPKLNTYNIVQFNQEMNKMGISLGDVGQAFNQLGVQGQQAFGQISAAATQTQQLAKQTTGVLDDMLDTLSRTAKWSIASGLINSFKGLIQETWSYTKKLDESLNNIRIVTGKSTLEMEKFANKANKAAQGLAASTTSYTNASLIYYQQGLSDKDVEARTAVTIKAANVTGQSAAEVSEQLTAVWNGYKVVAEEAESYVDKLAAVAATTAADLQELSEGMSKVASAANTMGVDIDQLSAQLSTIISVTRQDANVVGTALKTIYARLGDLKVDGADEFGTTLGDVSGQMQQMGIQVLEENGDLREMGDVIEEVASKWEGWTSAQRQAAAVAMAGKRQYNNLIALFENWNMYESALATSQNADGTLEKQQQTYKESIEAMLQEVSTAAERVKGALFDEDSIEGITDFLTGLLNVVNHVVKAFGGLKGLLPYILGLLLKNSKINGFLAKTFYDIGSSIKRMVDASHSLKILRQHLKEVGKQAKDTGVQMLYAEQRRMALQEMFRKGLISKEDYEKLTQYNEAVITNIKKQQAALVERDKLKSTLKGGDETQGAEVNKRAAAIHNLEEVEQTQQEIIERSLDKKTRKKYQRYKKAVNEKGIVLTDSEQAEFDAMEAQAKEGMSEEDKIAYGQAEKKKAEARKTLSGAGASLDDIERERKAGVDSGDNEALKTFTTDIENTTNTQVDLVRGAQKNLITDQETENGKELIALLEKIYSLKAEISKLETVDVEKQKKALQEKIEFEESGGLEEREKKIAENESKQDELITSYLNEEDQKIYGDLRAKQKEGTLSQEESTQLTSMMYGAREKFSSEENESFDAMAQDNSAIQAEIDAYNAAIKTINEYNEALTNAKKSLQDTTAEFNEKRKGLTPSLDQAKTSIAKTKEALEKLKKTKNLTKEQQKQIEALEKKLDSLQETAKGSFEQIGEDGSKTAISFEDVGTILNGVSDEVGTLEDQFEENGKIAVEEAEKIAEGTDEVTTSTENATDSQKAYREEAGKFEGLDLAGNISSLSSNIMMTVGSVNSLTSALQGLVEGSMDPWDAVSAIMMALLSMIPTIVSSVQMGMKLISAAGTATGGTLTKAGTTAQAAFGWISIIMTAVAALVALTVGLVKMFSKEEESQAEKAEKALEATRDRAKKAQEELKNTKQEYSSLLDAIEDYQTARTALDGLREGTEEWKKAVQELNMQVLDLVQQYPVLLDYMQSENGVLSISQEGFDKVIEEKQQAIKEAATSATFSNIAVKAAEKDVVQAKAGYNSAETAALMKLGAVEKNEDGTYSNNINFKALAKKYQDAQYNEKNGYYLSDSEVRKTDVSELGVDENLATVITNGAIEGDYVTALNQTTDQLAKALEDNYEAAIKNAEVLQANADATSKLEHTMLRQIAEEKGIADADTYANMALTVDDLGTSYDELLAESADEYWDKYLSDHAGSDQTNDDDALDDNVKESIRELYGNDASITGFDDIDWSKVESIESFKDIEFEVNGEAMTGADLVAKYGEEKIQAMLQEKNTELEKQINDYAAKGIDTRAAYFMNGSAFSYDQATADKANFSRADLENLQRVITDEGVNANIGSYLDSFETRVSETMAKVSSITSLTGEEAGFANFTLDDYQKMQNTMFKAQAAGGKDAIAALYESFSRDADALSLINEKIASVNWNDTASISTFITQLAEQGIIIDESNAAWNTFMDDVYDGTKQWVNNSQQVIDNLATIKELTGDIEVGDILSDEDYKRLLAISPEIAKMFIKTADGYKSLASSKELDKILKKQYQSLGDLKSFYTDVSEEISKSGVKGILNADFNKSGDAIDYMSKFASANNIDRYDSIFEYTGTSKDAVKQAYDYVTKEGVDTTSPEYIEYLNLLKSVANNINQAALDNENGLLNSRQGQEIWVTEMAQSWGEIQANRSNLDEDIYKKAEDMWKQNYLSEMGFSGLTQSTLSAEELEGHLENIRKLELDYYSDLNSKIENLEEATDRAFGAGRLAMLQEQVDLQKEYLERSKEQAATAKGTFDALFNDFLTNNAESLGVDVSTLKNTDGSMNLEAMNDLLASTTDETTRSNIERIIDLNSQMQDSASAAASAAWSLVDAQISQFKAQSEGAIKLAEYTKSLEEFSQKFKKFMNYTQGAANSLDVYGPESAADAINNAFDSFSNNRDLFNLQAGLIDKYAPMYTQMQTDYEDFSTKYATEAAAKIAMDVAEEKARKATEDYTIKDKEATAAEEFATEFIDTSEKIKGALETAQKEVESKTGALAAAEAAKTQAGIDEAAKFSTDIETALKAKEDAQDDLDNAKWYQKNDRKKAVKEAEEKYNDLIAQQEQARKDAEAAKQGAVDEADAALAAAKEKEAKIQAELNSLLAEYSEYGSTYEEIKATLEAQAKIARNTADDAKDTMDAANELYGEQTNAWTEAASATEDAAKTMSQNNPYAVVGANGELIFDAAAFGDDWESAISEGQSILEEMQGNLQDAYQGFISAQNELLELYDNQISKLSSINSLLQGSADLWKIVGKNATNYSDQLNSYYSTMTQNSQRSYGLALQQLNTAQAEYEKLTVDASQEMIDTVTKNLATAGENVLSAANEWMTAIATQFEEALTLSIDSFVKTASGLDLADISENWQLAITQDSRYLDEIEETYAKDNLLRNYQRSIDETDNITAQNKLLQARMKMEEELADIKEKQGKLTQYDLDRANAMYELTLKQIALEEAQQTANKMKLTRDAMGNYTYQYVADQDSIAKAEEELAAAENNLYNIDKERNQSLVEEYYSTMSEANAAIAEAMKEGDTERVQRLKDYYFGENGLLSGIQSELSTAQGNLDAIGKSLAGTDWTSSFSSFTDAIVNSDLSSLLTNIEGITSSSIDSFNSVSQTIDDLFQEGGVLSSAVSAISSSLSSDAELAIKTAKLTDATQKVLDELPVLTTEIKALEAILSGYGRQYQDWLDAQVNSNDAVTKNTIALEEATKANKAVAKALYESMDMEVPDYLAQASEET